MYAYFHPTTVSFAIQYCGLSMSNDFESGLKNINLLVIKTKRC